MDDITVSTTIHRVDDPRDFVVGTVSLDFGSFHLDRLAVDLALELLAICKEIKGQVTSAYPRTESARYAELYEGTGYIFEPLAFAHNKASLLYAIVSTDATLGERRLLTLVNELYRTAFGEPDVNRKLITQALSAFQEIEIDILKRQRESQGENWRSAFPDPHWDDVNERFLERPDYERVMLIEEIRREASYGDPENEIDNLVREEAIIDLGRLAKHWPEEARALAEELGLEFDPASA